MSVQEWKECGWGAGGEGGGGGEEGVLLTQVEVLVTGVRGSTHLKGSMEWGWFRRRRRRMQQQHWLTDWLTAAGISSVNVKKCCIMWWRGRRKWWRKEMTLCFLTSWTLILITEQINESCRADGAECPVKGGEHSKIMKTQIKIVSKCESKLCFCVRLKEGALI